MRITESNDSNTVDEVETGLFPGTFGHDLLDGLKDDVDHFGGSSGVEGARVCGRGAGGHGFGKDVEKEFAVGLSIDVYLWRSGVEWSEGSV